MIRKPGRDRVTLYLDASILRQVDTLMHDGFRGKRKYGARNELIDMLLQVWIEHETSQRGVRIETLVAAKEAAEVVIEGQKEGAQNG